MGITHFFTLTAPALVEPRSVLDFNVYVKETMTNAVMNPLPITKSPRTKKKPMKKSSLERSRSRAHTLI
jgi:hypothetical protein